MSGLIFANVSASAAIIFVLLLRRFFKEKFFAKVFVALWLLVIIRLLLPFEFYSSISVFEPEKKPIFAETNKILLSENFQQNGDFALEANQDDFAVTPQKGKDKISSEKILFGIWVFGAVSTGGFFAANHLCFVKKVLKTSARYDVPETYKTGRTRFYKSKNLASPLSFGVLRPAIVIPEKTAGEQLHFVLLHEQTHIKDRDAVLKILALLALSVNWFNPFVWFMVKIFERDMERYCDERVLKKIGAEKALFYANTILDFAERESLSFNYFSAASLCERVTSIMKTKKKKQNILVSVLVLAAVILVMTACGTLPEAEEKKPLETKNLAELMQGDKTETGKLVSMDGKTEKTAEEIAEEIGYMSFGKITAEGYYPDWMQPDSRIEYDENGVPKITEGGELLPQDLLGREEFSSGFPFTSVGSGIVTMMIQPNTVVEYNRNGALQNIYYVWPDGSLNLSPYSAIEVPEELIEVPEFIWPCEETDLNAVVGSYNGHTGIDIGHTHGAEIYASREGVVTEVDIGKKGYGYYVVIDHGEGFSTLYAHCSKILVEMGQKVEAGETIALTGSTGNSTGNHLHFELHYNGGIIDPQYLLVKD